MLFSLYGVGLALVSILLGAVSWLPLRRLRRVQTLAKQFAGPKTLPLLGNANIFIGLTAAEALQVIVRLFNEYGDTVKMWLGPSFSLLMGRLADVELVLGNPQLLDKAFEYDFLKNWLNEGLLVSKGRKWFKRRKVLTPAFHFKILEEYVEIFERQAGKFVENLEAACRRGHDIVDLGHGIHLCTLDVICGKPKINLSLNGAKFAGAAMLHTTMQCGTP